MNLRRTECVFLEWRPEDGPRIQAAFPDRITHEHGEWWAKGPDGLLSRLAPGGWLLIGAHHLEAVSTDSIHGVHRFAAPKVAVHTAHASPVVIPES